jgi:penicillin-binding protein 1A
MYAKLIRLTWSFFYGSIVFIVLLVLAVQGNWFGVFGEMPDLAQLENPRSEVASVLYSADGVELGKYFRENRSPVEYDEISRNAKNALLATEDIRFKEHSGIDLIGTLSIPYYLITFQKRGASTISQQLAKNLFNTRQESYRGSFRGTAGTIFTKIKEWILAVRIERSYTKEEIMTMYFNTVDFGNLAFGIKVAAKTYFKTTPDQLSIPQSALLVGLLKGPSFYSPINHPERALARRNTVLDQMQKYSFISAQTLDSMKKLPLGIERLNVDSHNQGLATYFRSVVREDILKWCKENGYDLFADGLKIYTTIDSRMQRYAEEAVIQHMKKQQALFFEHWKGRNPWVNENFQEIKSVLTSALAQSARQKYLVEKYGAESPKIEAEMKKPIKMRVFSWNHPNFEVDTLLSPYDSVRYYKHFLHCALTSMEPKTGHIKAWVGGINHKYFQYDNVKQGARQPGSTFKPIIYSIAIEMLRFDPCYQVNDAPITFQNPNGTTWTPNNSDGYSYQSYTLRQAMGRSINTISASLIKALSQGAADGLKGSAIVVDYAKNKFGISTPLDPVPAISLGTSDVLLIDMVAAYGTFVNGGTWTQPIYLLKIEDQYGKELVRFTPQTVEALSEETAYAMTYMLRGATEERGGTALGLHNYNFIKSEEGVKQEVGGKTGTTSNYSDAWFIGITKDLVTGVWSGAYDRSVHFRSIQFGQGARQAMPAFAVFSEKVFADKRLPYRKGPFPKPAGGFAMELNCEKYEKEIITQDTTNFIRRRNYTD